MGASSPFNRQTKPRGAALAALLLVWLLVGLIGCAPGNDAAAAVDPAPTRVAPAATDAPTTVPVITTTPNPAVTPSPTATIVPTVAPTAVPTATPTPSVVPTSTPDRTIPCDQRDPKDDLFTIVTLTYGLSRYYEPNDLVDLAEYVPGGILKYPTELRRLAAGPLGRMVNDMRQAGLDPRIISGYRSYSAQAIARQKWETLQPERVDMLSAPPGHSEHQLGTAVDFGSPELPGIVGQEGIEFHTWFYKTSEGAWLLENAHRYGFTLSYPREASEVTGFTYEPWHYRYVGVEMATHLKENATSLTQHQLENEPAPCVPKDAQS